LRRTEHYRERVVDRLTAEERKRLWAIVRAEREHIGPHESVALYAMRLPAYRTAECGSNGRNVVVIIRNRHVTTVMLRADHQVVSAARLRVNRLVLKVNPRGDEPKGSYDPAATDNHNGGTR